MSFLLFIFQSIWFIWPAYTANAFPTVVKGKRPLDCGKKIGKNRVFGNSKTIEGTIGGIVFGVFIGAVQTYLHQYLPASFGLIKFTPEMLVLMCVGTLVGDVLGSFLKRRMDIKPGQPAILMDQVGFLLIALIFVSPVFIPAVEMIILLILITPPIHLLTNVVGYSLKLKKYPW